MRKWNEHCSWRFIFFIRLKVLNEWKWNADGAIFSFAVSSSSVTVIEQIHLKGGWQRNLLGNVWESTGKAFALSLKRNSIYVWKKREANQCCRSVISFQITEDVVHCREMGALTRSQSGVFATSISTSGGGGRGWAFTQGQLSRD